MNYPKMDPDRVAKLMAEGRMHLEFMAKIYKKQLDQGRHFLHEHPATAVSWDERSIVKLMAHSDVHVTVADQCQYGLKTRGEDGTPMPALKPTRFMTSSVQMSKLLQKRCKKDHKHQPLVSGRCAAAAFYPARLIRTIIKGIRATKDAEGLLPKVNGVHAVVECDASVAVQSKCKKVGGGQITITFDDRNFKPLYRDEYTNEILPAHLIKAAIIDELDYFNSKVWEVTDVQTMKRYKDHKLVRCRWVLCNKGDAASPDVRARLVACEFNYGTTTEASFYAATPPLEAKKILFPKYADEPVRRGKQQRISFVDIRKAYFNALPKRNIFMSLPKELGLPGHWVAKQVRCVYGTRDAGALWEDTYRAALEDMGFKSGVASPCIFSHADRDLVCVVHGDDFTTLGNDDNLNWYEAELAKHFELKLRGRLGVACSGDNEIRILNRIVRIIDRGLEYEADARHVELIVESLQLQDSKPVTSPGVKNPDSSTEAATKDDDPSTSATVQAGLEPDETSEEMLEPENLLDCYG